MFFRLCLLPLFFACCASGAEPFQNWIDEAIQAGGGVVTVPPGEHVLPRGLHIKDAKKLAFRGMDKERCILKLSADAPKTDALIEISGAGEGIEIANLTLSAPAAVLVQVRASDGVALKDIAVRDCLFESFGAQGVRVEGAEACVVERCSFRDGGQSAVAFLKGTQAGRAQGNQVIRVATGFDLQDARACTIIGNEVRDAEYGVRIQQKQAADAKAAHVIRGNGLFGMRVTALDIASATPPPQQDANEVE